MAQALLEILSESGNLQVTGTGGIGYGLSATGALTLNADPQNHPQPMVIGNVSVTGVNPVFAFKGNGEICVERTVVNGSQFTFYLRAQSSVAIGVQYWVFDSAAQAIKDPTMAGLAAQFCDEYGVVTFDATMAAMRVAEAIETPKASTAVPSGQFVNLESTQNINVPAGKVYAIVQSTPSFVFTTHDTGGYSNSQNPPNTPIRDDGGVDDGGVYRWRQQELQSYQATGGYIGGSTIQVGMTMFERFNVGWQPWSATPRIDVYGQPRHLIIDVTNFTAAGGISPTIVNVGVNANTRTVTNGGAESIAHSSTPAVTASVSGGTAPYAYLWQFVSGDDQVSGAGLYNGASFYTQTVNQPAGTIRSAIYRLRVTDANGFVGYSPDVTFSHTAETYQNDYVPNPLTLSPLTLVTNSDHEATSDVTDLTGFNQPITLRVQSYDPVGVMDAQAVYVYRAPLGTTAWEYLGSINPQSGGSYMDFVVQPNSRLHYVIDSVTGSGRRDTHFDLVVWNLSNPGGAAVLSNKRITITIDANNDFNVGDYHPDGISVPNLTGYVSNEPELYTDGRFFQITGINRQIWLRFIRTYYELSQSGGIYTRRLLIFHSTSGSGGPWTPYFVGAGTPENPQPYTDVACNNGDWFYVQGWIGTSGGIGSASWRNYIDWHDGSTVLGRLSTFDISGTVDNDNNYNVVDINPDPLTGFTDVWAVTNDPTVWTGPVASITGISQAINLRIERYSFSGAMTHLAVHVYRDYGQGWVHQGSFDPRAGGLQYVDFPVNPGDNIHYAVEGGTAAGRQDAAFNMVVWNMSNNTQISSKTVNVSVDNDNNYYPVVDYDPDPIAFSNMTAYSSHQFNTDISTTSPVYYMSGMGAAATFRIYFGVYNHNFEQFSNGQVQAGDGALSGYAGLQILRNGQYVGGLDHYLYGYYNGAEQFQYVDLPFNPNDSIQFIVSMHGDINEQSAGMNASTQGGIYVDRIGGARVGAFTHTMTINKPASRFGGGGPIFEV